MANRFWADGGVTADWSDTANWSATDGGATGAAVPANSDSVYLKRGTRSIVAGLNQSAVTLALLHIMDGFGGNASGVNIMDASGNPLQISATTVRIDNRRFGTIKLSGTYTTVDNKMLGAGRVFLTAGSATNLYTGADGLVTVADDVEITRFITAGGGAFIDTDATSPVDLEVSIGAGAVVEIRRRIKTAIIDGTLIVAGAADGAASSGSSRWRVNAGGVLDHRASGDVAELEVVRGGRAIGDNSPGYATKPAITSLLQHAESGVNFPESLYTITAKTELGKKFGK